MKKLFVSLFACAISVAAFAQQPDWNVRLDYMLSNYEYERSHRAYDNSYTLHAVRLSPEAGVLIKQNDSIYHRVRVGIDLYHDMGSGISLPGALGELLYHYDIEVVTRRGGYIEAVAGVFPRQFTEGQYAGPFFDDDILFKDNNLEGVLFKYRNARFYTEAGLDWPGMKSLDRPESRERFRLLSSGTWNFTGDFNLGWTASLYHYSMSSQLFNVVDNHMINPWVEWAPQRGSAEGLRLNAGALLTYQCDRKASAQPSTPLGFYSRQSFSRWNLILDNHFYYGDDLMPFYESSYEGQVYGRDLYFGDLAFHTRFDHPSWADFLTLKYMPRLNDWLDICVAVSLRFGEASEALQSPVFRGWQQTLAVRVNLDALRPHPAGTYRRNGSPGDYIL